MDLAHSYFAITSPITILDRWLHPFRFSKSVQLGDYPLEVRWTKRADRALAKRAQPLNAEMQLYFSCVVKKRVVFENDKNRPTVTVTDKLAVNFRAVPASSCSPEEFASNYPIDGEFNSDASRKMHPCRLDIDYKNQQWSASFQI
ncbi:MAG: hypothetical protein PVJ63_11210 [Thioalkalispiraceae bacterium]|jgi:hypothetical protein